MTLFEEKLRELEKIDVAPTRRGDFDGFWEEVMEQVESVPLNVKGETIAYPIESMTVRDITYEGLDGTPIHAWLLLPPGISDGKVPVVVHYHGAGGSRHFPSSYVQWVAMGCAVVAPDVRLQGGTTGSRSGFSAGNMSGYFSAGVLDKRGFYMYHTWTDALRAVRVAVETPEIDDARICVEGGSQGGALSLAVAALRHDIALCMADVPSNSWLEKRVFDRAGGANAVSEYLRRHPDMLDAVEETLSYYDLINLADRITCPTLVSAGLRDPICPVDNVYAAFNKIPSEKEIVVYPFGEHDGGGAYHDEKKLAFLKTQLLAD